MHSTKRTMMRLITLGTLLIGALVLAGTAEAGDRNGRRDGRGREARVDRNDPARVTLREARRTDRRLDRRGAVIDGHFDALALIAAVSGEFELARELDRTGNRIERRYDRRGDRVLRQARKAVRHDHGRKLRARGHEHGEHHWQRGHAKRSHASHRHHDGCGHRGHDRRAKRGRHDDSFALRLHLGHR